MFAMAGMLSTLASAYLLTRELRWVCNSSKGIDDVLLADFSVEGAYSITL